MERVTSRRRETTELMYQQHGVSETALLLCDMLNPIGRPSSLQCQVG